MTTLDFTDCKTPEDVEKVFEENKNKIPTIRKIIDALEENDGGSKWKEFLQ